MLLNRGLARYIQTMESWAFEAYPWFFPVSQQKENS
jgi:hypothetical protein